MTQLISETLSLCPACKQSIEAQIIERDGAVYMLKRCETHGDFETLIASDANWYRKTMTLQAKLTPPPFKTRSEKGCPFDCGACPQHSQNLYLPVIALTSACNLHCPVCYTINNSESPFHMSRDEFGAILDAMRSFDPERRIVNLTGGEPTCHPDIAGLVQMCADRGIHRITMSTHGLTFLRNEELLSELARLKTRIVLSFDSFHEEANRILKGADLYKAKKRVLSLLEKYDVDTTLIPVVAKGINDGELGDFVKLVLDKSFLRSLEIHSMTFTGEGGSLFDQSGRLTVPDILKAIEIQTSGKLKMSDFVPSPCAHPLCYQTCYLLETVSGNCVPFTRFMEPEQIRKMLEGSLYIEPNQKAEDVLRQVIGELWAREPSSEKESELFEDLLVTLKKLTKELFSDPNMTYSERQYRAERAVKTIYLHSHMDEYNFDNERIRQCCVGVPDSQGGMIPTCAYNVLYRECDERFSTNAKALKTLKRFSSFQKPGNNLPAL